MHTRENIPCPARTISYHRGLNRWSPLLTGKSVNHLSTAWSQSHSNYAAPPVEFFVWTLAPDLIDLLSNTLFAEESGWTGQWVYLETVQTPYGIQLSKRSTQQCPPVWQTCVFNQKQHMTHLSLRNRFGFFSSLHSWKHKMSLIRRQNQKQIFIDPWGKMNILNERLIFQVIQLQCNHIYCKHFKISHGYCI